MSVNSSIVEPTGLGAVVKNDRELYVCVALPCTTRYGWYAVNGMFLVDWEYIACTIAPISILSEGVYDEAYSEIR